jgi:serine/threonine protein kinase
MKLCPQCKTSFPDHAETCPTHGGLLSEIIDLKPGMLIRNTYRIVRKLGEGGFGAVYLAEQTLMDELRAIKFLSRQLALDEAFTARFRREVRTLRHVRHRNVVDCGDLERAEDDSLFFSMEYVDGPDLRDFLEDAPRPFDVPLVLEITRGIAEGLGAAHAKGMVHRDIKPENILLARDRESYIPKIADFGIVAIKESSMVLTQTGGTMLTVAYAAPEQWRGMPAAELDGRTDLYALGGVLLKMLTGQTAFSAESYEGWAMQHLNAAPQPPSNLRPELVHWNGLDALVLRLLAKDRDERPKDIAEVLGMLDAVRYVVPPPHEPTVIEPRPPIRPRPKERGPRWAYWGAGAILLVVAALATLYLHFSPTQPSALSQVQSRPAADPTIFGTRVAFSRDGRTLAAAEYDVDLWDLVNKPKSLSRTLHFDHESPLPNVMDVAFSPDGSTLAVSRNNGTVRLWDVASGGVLRTWQASTDGPDEVAVAFSPDGRTLASSSSHAIKLWDVARGKALRIFRRDESVNFPSPVAFSPDGRTLASASGEKGVKLWDVTSGKSHALQGHTVYVNSVAFSPDGRTLASGSADFTIKLWDVTSGKVLRTLEGQQGSLTFSPDGRTLASGSDRTVKLWDVATGGLLRTLDARNWVGSVAFSPDGRTLASASETIQLWDVAGGRN